MDLQIMKVKTGDFVLATSCNTTMVLGRKVWRPDVYNKCRWNFENEGSRYHNDNDDSHKVGLNPHCSFKPNDR